MRKGKATRPGEEGDLQGVQTEGKPYLCSRRGGGGRRCFRCGTHHEQMVRVCGVRAAGEQRQARAGQQRQPTGLKRGDPHRPGTHQANSHLRILPGGCFEDNAGLTIEKKFPIGVLWLFTACFISSASGPPKMYG